MKPQILKLKQSRKLLSKLSVIQFDVNLVDAIRVRKHPVWVKGWHGTGI
jgi:hypothetical protein